MKKIFSIISLVLLITIAMCSASFAFDPGSVSSHISTFSGVSNLQSVGQLIIGTIQVIGTIVSIAVLTYVGIKFMLASPGEKAALKTVLFPYIIGAVVVFSAANLAQIIYTMAKSI